MTVKLLGADDQAGDAGGGAGIINFQKFTAEASGTMTEFYLRVNATADFGLAVYTDSGGLPSALLEYKNAQTLATGWSVSSGWSVSIAAGTDYWLAILCGGNIRYNNAGGARGYKAEAYSASYVWADPWTASLDTDAILVLMAGWGTVSVTRSFGFIMG